MTAEVWLALGEGNLPKVSIFYQKWFSKFKACKSFKYSLPSPPLNKYILLSIKSAECFFSIFYY